jgi:hypothetical protein
MIVGCVFLFIVFIDAKIKINRGGIFLRPPSWLREPAREQRRIAREGRIE